MNTPAHLLIGLAVCARQGSDWRITRSRDLALPPDWAYVFAEVEHGDQRVNVLGLHLVPLGVATEDLTSASRQLRRGRAPAVVPMLNTAAQAAARQSEQADRNPGRAEPALDDDGQERAERELRRECECEDRRQDGTAIGERSGPAGSLWCCDESLEPGDLFPPLRPPLAVEAACLVSLGGRGFFLLKMSFTGSSSSSFWRASRVRFLFCRFTATGTEVSASSSGAASTIRAASSLSSTTRSPCLICFLIIFLKRVFFSLLVSTWSGCIPAARQPR